jgi:hypothetical protein
MQAAVVMTGVLLATATIVFAVPALVREGAHLLVVPDGALRGTLVPPALVPLTFALLTIGTSLALAGALHAAPPARLAILFVYLAVATGFLGLAHGLEGASGVTTWWAWPFIAGVPLLFAVRWRAQPRPAIELAALLVLVAGAFAITGHAVIEADRFTGRAFALQELTVLLGQLELLALPLLFVSGLDVVGFGANAALVLLGFIDRRIGSRVVIAALALFGGWRTRDVVVGLVHRVSDDGAGDALWPVLGSALLVALIGAWWLALGRVGARPGASAGEDDVDHGAGRVRLPLGMAFAGSSLLLVPMLLGVQSLTFFGVWPGLLDVLTSIAGFLSRDSTITAYRCLVAIGMCVVGLRAARREQRTLAMFLGTVGLSDLLTQLFAHAGPLDALLWDDTAPVDLVWTLTFVAVAATWAVRRRLTETRAERLLFVLLLAGLLSQFTFVSDPLAPFLGFAGVGFVVFGLVWGFLTGGGWTNTGTVRFPRPSRVLLFLGYSLFSISLLTWFAATHDIAELGAIRDAGSNGVHLLGQPLLYSLFALGLAAAAVDRPIVHEDEPAVPIA